MTFGERDRLQRSFHAAAGGRFQIVCMALRASAEEAQGGLLTEAQVLRHIKRLVTSPPDER